jgi:tetratricopeptide (TPR) repeat protein
MLAGYLHIRGRWRLRVAPDAATLLDGAIQLAASGQPKEAIAMLTEAIRLNPRLWQALQYRGELYLQSGSAEAAITDFNQAILLAPEERHLRVLRGYAQTLMEGDLKNSP